MKKIIIFFSFIICAAISVSAQTQPVMINCSTADIPPLYASDKADTVYKIPVHLIINQPVPKGATTFTCAATFMLKPYHMPNHPKIINSVLSFTCTAKDTKSVYKSTIDTFLYMQATGLNDSLADAETGHILLQGCEDSFITVRLTNKVLNKGEQIPVTGNGINNYLQIDLGDPSLKTVGLHAKKYDQKLKLRTGHTLQVQLLNINPFKYNYTINTDPVDMFNSTSPFDSIDLQKFVTAAGSDTPMAQTTKSQLITAVAADSTAVKQTTDRISTLSYLKTTASPLNRPITLVKANGTSANSDSLRIAKKSTDSTLRSTDSSLASHKKILAQQKKTLKKDSLQLAKVDSLYPHDSIFVVAIDSAYALFLYAARTIAENKGVFDINTAEDAMYTTIFEQERKKLTADASSFFIRYEHNFQLLNRADTNLASPANQHELHNIMDKLQKIKAGLNDFISKLDKISLKEYTLPIDVNGKNIDKVEVTVSRSLKSGNTLPDTYTYDVWLIRGFKIDVSGGLFFTNLVDNQFTTSDTTVRSFSGGDSINEKKIITKNKNDLAVGFGSMINISYRLGASWVKPALSIGLLLTTAQKYQVLAGGGLILGKDARVVLHGGLSIGQVTTLQSNFKADSNMAYNLGPTSTVPTVDRFKTGYFFGFTYNITKTKVQKGNTVTSQ
jgi:hypothetical protein